MKKWDTIFAIAGAIWMILVLQVGSLPLARFSKYPGTYTARFISEALPPSSALVWAFDFWLVLTSAVEWLAVGLTLRAVLNRLSQ